MEWGLQGAAELARSGMGPSGEGAVGGRLWRPVAHGRRDVVCHCVELPHVQSALGSMWLWVQALSWVLNYALQPEPVRINVSIPACSI